MTMSTDPLPTSPQTPLPSEEPDALPFSVRLTRTEIDALRQRKKAIADHVNSVYPDRESLLKACKLKD